MDYNQPTMGMAYDPMNPFDTDPTKAVALAGAQQKCGLRNNDRDSSKDSLTLLSLYQPLLAFISPITLLLLQQPSKFQKPYGSHTNEDSYKAPGSPENPIKHLGLPTHTYAHTRTYR